MDNEIEQLKDIIKQLTIEKLEAQRHAFQASIVASQLQLRDVNAKLDELCPPSPAQTSSP